MKKVFKSALVIAVTSLIALSSCKEADEATPVASLSSGTIKGQLFYDNNEVNDADGSEFVNTDVPTGAIIRYKYTDIITMTAVTGTTTVDASGSFSFNVPTNDTGVDVNIDADDFEGSLTFDYQNEDSETRETTEEGFYAGISIGTGINVLPGKTEIISKKQLGAFTSTANPAEQND